MSRNVRAKDLLRPPTLITAASFGLVLDGVRKIDTREGKIEIALGRLGDLADGLVARKFDQSSDAGAIADATCDKLGILAIGSKIWHENLAPKQILAGIAVKHAVNAVATTYNGLHDADKRSIRPPKSGKFSMAADNLALGAFLLADECKNPQTKNIARGVGYAAATAGLAFGIYSTARYLHGDFDEEK